MRNSSAAIALLSALLGASSASAGRIYRTLGAYVEGGYLCGRELENGRQEACYTTFDPRIKCSNSTTLEELKAAKNGNCTDLRPLTLIGIDLSQGDLKGAILSGKSLRAANLTGTELSGALLSEANLSDALLDGADLDLVDAGWAQFGYARLGGARFLNANLNNSGFTGACLNGALLRGADVVGARFDGADLRGAVLETPSLCRASLAGAKWDKKTRFSSCAGETTDDISAFASRRGMVLVEEDAVLDPECEEAGRRRRW